MYLNRLSKAGMASSVYYQSKIFNHALGGEDDLPNCTQYVISRSYESCEVDEPFPMFKNRSAGGYPEAGSFYKETTLPHGNKIRIGSIACFTNHVAFVEDVYEDGLCLLTDSRYDSNKSLRNDRYWRYIDKVKLEVGKKPNINGVGELQGFIYLPINNARKPRKQATEQIEITEQMVNVRKDPDGDICIKGCYCPVGIYDVINSNMVDAFVWYKIDESSYVRSGDWLEYYPKDSKEDLEKEIKMLKAKLKEINKLSEV